MLFKINIIDDEKNLNDLVRTYLEKEGYSVCSFYTYDEALLHKDDDVHLWLIDIMLDKASGFELFNEIKASKPKMPIIFMSARDQEFDRIIGLEKGSDDYITKPFNIKEVILRINNLLKRAYDNPTHCRGGIPGSSVWCCGRCTSPAGPACRQTDAWKLPPLRAAPAEQAPRPHSR